MTLSNLDRLARSALLGCAVLAALPAVAMASAVYSTEQDANPKTGNWRVCVMQDGGANQVAGVQMELSWDAACMSSASASGKPKCESNPDTGKTVQSAMKGGNTLKAIFLSFSDVEPIPDGWLFCCDFSLADKTNSAGCPVTIGNVIGSTSQGQRIPVQAAAPPRAPSGSSGGSGGGSNGGNYNNGGGDSGDGYNGGSAGGGTGSNAGGGTGSNAAGGQAAVNGGSGGGTTGSAGTGSGTLGGGAAAGTGSANAGGVTGGGVAAGESDGNAGGGTGGAAADEDGSAAAPAAQGSPAQTTTPAAATSTPKPAATSTPKPVSTPTRAPEPTETPAKSGGLGGCQLNR